MHARICSVLVLFVIFFCGLQTASAINDPATTLPLSFTANQGQWADDILFRADAGGTVMWFTADGIYYQFTRRVETVSGDGVADLASEKLGAESFNVETILVKATFVGANPGARAIGEGVLEYTCNYFLGNDRTKWRTDVPNYSAIVLEDIYPGIDIRFSGAQSGRPMYEFVADAGADLTQVQVAYDGAVETVSNVDGSVTILTEWGTTLAAIGSSNAQYAPVAGGYIEDGVKSFSTAGELIYSTYLGGSERDLVYSIAVDASGCAYAAGYSAGDFTMQDAYDSTYNVLADIFVTKFSEAGNSLVYSTFIGGNDDDHGIAVAVDASNCAYVTGHTSSSDYPTQNAFDASYNGRFDGVVTKLSAAGNALEYSTYLGGDRSDVGYGIAVDASACAYVAGYACSADFPTQNAFDASHYGDTYDVFVTKFSTAGNTLVYSTFVGGEESDIGFDIAIDPSGCAYVTGLTRSVDFPMQNAFDESYNGENDVLVFKLAASGDALVYSTVLGGANYDVGYNIAVDASNCAYVTGYTLSPGYPTQNAYDATYDWDEEAFVTKLSAEGNTLDYSTFLGGGGRDRGHGIAVDASGCAYLAGLTSSEDFPTMNAYDDSHNGNWDAFVTKLSTGGNSLIISTYFGGSAVERVYDLAMDGSGDVYMTGWTGSDDFPLQNPYDNTLASDLDAFVTKMGLYASSCCNGATGNVNCDSKDAVDISDLTMLVNHLFITFDPLCCLDEANTNGDSEGRVDISDLMQLVNHLFITYEDLATLD